MRCPRCGNENPGLNRFCGMCGATLVGPAPPSAAVRTPPEPAVPMNPSPRVASVTTASHQDAAAPPRAQEPVPAREPEPSRQAIISGPSFLGLNQPGPAPDPEGSGHGSRSETSSRSLDYLLEEEEEPKSGAGKFILIAIALVLAVGLGYLRWRNQGLDWLMSGMKKSLSGASSAANSPPAADVNSNNSATPDPGYKGNAATPSAGPVENGTPGAPTPSVASGPNSATPANSAGANANGVIPVDSDSSAKVPPAGSATSTADKGPSKNPAAPGDSSANSSDTGSSASTPTASAKKSASSKASESNDNEEEADNSDDTDSAPVTKPTAALAKPPAAKPVDVVVQAEKYIYGRGVPQDCDRGVKMVRQAANQSNAKAMISLGALYSAGLCTPRDLPTAYRWFAIALRKDPDNNSLQTDLNKLWSEMTPPERQLAIKLSQ